MPKESMNKQEDTSYFGDDPITITIGADDKFELYKDGTFCIPVGDKKLEFRLIKGAEGKTFVHLCSPDSVRLVVTAGDPLYISLADILDSVDPTSPIIMNNLDDMPIIGTVLLHPLDSVQNIDLALPKVSTIHKVATKQFGVKPRVVFALKNAPSFKDRADAEAKFVAKGISAGLMVRRGKL